MFQCSMQVSLWWEEGGKEDDWLLVILTSFRQPLTY